jgi:hypothetical protein
MTVGAHRGARREDPIHQEQWLQRQYDSASTSESTRIDDDPAVHRGNLYTELLQGGANLHTELLQGSSR